MPTLRVLVLDDESQVRKCVQQQVNLCGYEVATAANPAEALALLEARFFDLVICDIRMPGTTGIDFLRTVAALHPDTGIVMMSGDHNLANAVEAMRLGALDYISKPFNVEQIEKTLAGAISRIRERSSRSLYLRQLESTLRDQGIELNRTLDPATASEGTLNAPVAALDAREHETEAHSRRVGDYALYLATVMGVESSAREDIRKGALLHDVGKIGISDRILLKPGELTPDEWVEMRRHPEIGYWILAGSNDLRSASEIVISHHERWDGSGYPHQLKGADIPLGARIVSVVDAFEVLTSDRPYRRGETYEFARCEIEKNAGTQFDPLVVEHFLRVPACVWQDIRSRTLIDWARVPGSPSYAAIA